MCKTVKESLESARKEINAQAGKIHARIALLQYGVKARLKEVDKISKRIDTLERLSR